MITRIEAHRYRCFERLDLALEQFQVFVGPNGSGKTTLLDIPILLGQMLAARSVETAFFKKTATHPRPRTDYAGDLIYKRAGSNFVLAIEARLPETVASELLEKHATRLSKEAVRVLRSTPHRWLTRIRYEVEFELFKEALQIGQEYLLLLAEGANTTILGTGGLIGEALPKRSPSIVPVILRPRGGKTTFRPETEARGPRVTSTTPSCVPIAICCDGGNYWCTNAPACS